LGLTFKILIIMKNNLESNKISDLTTYTESMKKTLMDKAFFIGMVDSSIFVDFGCADGALLNFLHMLFPAYTYIGYDLSESMIEKAKQETHSDIKYFSKLEDVKKYLKTLNGEKTLILNSVIHEVYSYSTNSQIDEFYDFVFGGYCNYIAIRDMMPSMTINRDADKTDVARVRAFGQQPELQEFENIWGSITNNKNLIHYLLKYRYLANWKREVRENYFPIFMEQFLTKIPKGFSVDYQEEFTLPYMKRKVYDDFQINVKDYSHVKMIIRKY